MDLLINNAIFLLLKKLVLLDSVYLTTTNETQKNPFFLALVFLFCCRFETHDEYIIYSIYHFFPFFSLSASYYYSMAARKFPARSFLVILDIAVVYFFLWCVLLFFGRYQEEQRV